MTLIHSRTGSPTWRQSLRSLLARLTLPRPVPDSVRAQRLHRLADVCAVLDQARAIVEHGWVQDRWFVPGRPDRVAGAGAACLVGAVVRATAQVRPRAAVTDAGPAIDVVWDAWQETRGFGGPGVAGRAAPWDVRMARIRDLTRWNDHPGRTRDEVVRLLDLAVSRAVMTAMTAPPAGERGAARSN
jgi:hypothetical protein